MQTPDPLPQPGAWLVMADGSMYEVRHCDGEHGPCTVPPADAEGVFYWSVDEGERIWTPWSDVHAVGTYESAETIAADIVRAEALAEWTPPATIARYVVTIRHGAGGNPYTPDMLRALGEVMSAAFHAAGVPATATVEALDTFPAGAWTCPEVDADHWEKSRWTDDADGRERVRCGQCGTVSVNEGGHWYVDDDAL